MKTKTMWAILILVALSIAALFGWSQIRRGFSARAMPSRIEMMAARGARRLAIDRSYLLNEAVEHYLELNAYHAGLIAKGLRAAKEGKFVAHSEVKKLIQKMGGKK